MDICSMAILAGGGYAQPYEFPPDSRYADRIMILARTARNEGKGLWGISRQGDNQRHLRTMRFM